MKFGRLPHLMQMANQSQPRGRTKMSSDVIATFLQSDQAIQRGRPILRIKRSDKKIHFQGWFQERLSCQSVNDSNE